MPSQLHMNELISLPLLDHFYFGSNSYYALRVIPDVSGKGLLPYHYRFH